MPDKRRFFLVHDTARRNAMECVRTAPDGYVVTVQPKTRTLEQNALLHALLGQISERCTWAGKRWDIEDWKRLLTAAWCRANAQGVEMVPAVDGQGFDVLYRRTSRLTTRECSDLCEYIQAWAAEKGIEIREAATC